MKFLRSEHGSSMIEFSGFVSVLVILLVGIVDYALTIQQSIQVSEAASAGAAFGATPGNQKNLAGMKSAAQAAAPAITGLSVTTTNLFTCTPGGVSVSSGTSCSNYGTPIEYVVVQTSTTVPEVLHYLGMPTNMTLNGTSSFRVPWTP